MVFLVAVDTENSIFFFFYLYILRGFKKLVITFFI